MTWIKVLCAGSRDQSVMCRGIAGSLGSKCYVQLAGIKVLCAGSRDQSVMCR